MEALRNLPAVDKLLNQPEIIALINKHGDELVKYCIRNTINDIRKKALESKAIPDTPEIVDLITYNVQQFHTKSLRNVINATGVVVHTNLGRAPLSKDILNEVIEILHGYNNLEFDLDKGQRGSRNTHITELLKFLTGAEDVLIVNNNAAALMLILRTFAKDKEVIVSRGELIEIGGSFRLPDIMAASDCKMVEVGTTNKTKASDYEKNISANTGLLLKAHQSNYIIQGFTQEAKLEELVAIGKKFNIPAVYDMGSGLLRKTSIEIFKDEPDVKQTLSTGIDLVCFSGDKLLGGAQAGIIAGKKEMIAILKKEPLVRALRVGKTTLALMEAAMSYYLDEKLLFKKNRLFEIMTNDNASIKLKAKKLQKILGQHNMNSTIVESEGQCGGGALPGKTIPSWSVRIDPGLDSNKKNSIFAEKLYYGMMKHNFPVVAVLKKGDVYFDVLTIQEEQLELLGEIINDIFTNIQSS